MGQGLWTQRNESQVPSLQGLSAKEMDVQREIMSLLMLGTGCLPVAKASCGTATTSPHVLCSGIYGHLL